MTPERDKLMDTLFNTDGVELVNFHFTRGTAKNVSPEDVCREINKAMEQIASGSDVDNLHFGDADLPTVDILTKLRD